VKNQATAFYSLGPVFDVKKDDAQTSAHQTNQAQPEDEGIKHS